MDEPPDVFDPAPRAFPGQNAYPADLLMDGADGDDVGGASPLPHDVPPPVGDPAIAAELALLREIRNGVRGSAINIAITEEAINPLLTQDFPVPGAQRWLIPRQPTGGSIALAEGVPTDVLFANRSRIGGSLVNEGEQNVRLFLVNALVAAAGKSGHGTLWLAKNGGSWDFRLGTLVWGGSISAQPVAGKSSIAVVEV